MNQVFIVTGLEEHTAEFLGVRGVYNSAEAALSDTIKELWHDADVTDGDEIFRIGAARNEGFPFLFDSTHYVLTTHEVTE